MNRMALLLPGIILGLACATPAHAHDHQDVNEQARHADAHEQAQIRLTPEQMRRAALRIEAVKPRPVPRVLRAPGVVRYNAYRLAEITTLTDGIIIAREARLGDHVKKRAPLLTLRSTALAQIEAEWLRARADYRKNKQEFDRLRPLARDGVVSKARMQRVTSALAASKARMLAASATLSAHGLGKGDLKRLEQGKGFGLLVLRAPIAGTVVDDTAVLGQHVTPGDRLMRIADEDTLWVEANLPPERISALAIGARAMVETNDKSVRAPARVIAFHHELDAATRTAVVRMQVDNSQHRLHPGMFVNAELSVGAADKALLLPAEAVQRQGVEQVVFVETRPGVFERREVQAEAVGLGMMRIRSGLKRGERVVTRGAFALLSELLKSGFEAHQH